MAQQHSLLTPSGTITIAQAQPSHIDIVISILEEVGQWLLERDIYQWLPGSFRRDRIASSFELGQVYLAKQGEEVIGTLTLQWSDKLMWGDVPGDAGYVHRLAIRHAFAGMGLGRLLLQWAEDTAASVGKHYLRLDCWTDNPALCQYYERAGYICRGEIVFQGKQQVWKTSLYEKTCRSK
jgi:GNAT superfamily N-acetyltransferase